MSSPDAATQIIRPARNFAGSLVLPGDKSISHRYAMLAGFAEGITRLTNFSTGADPHSSLACMAALGAQVEQDAGRRSVEITGANGRFREPAHPLDCGNSGSTMRMLAGLLAAQPHRFTLIGDESLSARPMERIRKPLARMGAEIHLSGGDGGEGGHAPMQIVGHPLTAISFESPIASAQVKTAVLFAGLQASGATSLLETVRTRDHTEHALRAFGATLDRSKAADGATLLQISGGQQLRAVDATIPGDISSAAFFLAAALLFPDSNLVLDTVGMNPTRAVLLDVVTALGGRIRVLNVEEHFGELAGTIQVNTDPNPRPRSGPFEISGALAAQLIDEIPVLAAIAPFTRTGMRIREARELRVKESDRIDLVARNLRSMGAELTEFEDGLDIPGGQELHGASIDSGHDHRIAMAFSIAALRASGDTEIHGAEAAAISFPEFFTALSDLAQR